MAEAVPNEKLRQYLRELTPEARALLAAELERARLRGENPPGADMILEELRVETRDTGRKLPRLGNAQRLFFAPVEPFLVDDTPERKHRGRIARACLTPIWEWIARDLMPQEAKTYVDQVNLLLAANGKKDAAEVARAFQDLAEQRMREIQATSKSDDKAGRRVAAQNRIRALFVAQGLPAPRGAKAWSTTGLAGIATQAKPLAECGPDELWRGLLDLSLTEYRQVCELVAQAEAQLDALGKQNADVILLQTTPGLGPRTAEVVAAYLNDATRFKTTKQVSAYSGMVPRQHQSGEMDRRGRITKRGPALLRKLLVETISAIRRASVATAAQPEGQASA